MKTGLILVAMLVVGGPAAGQGYDFRYDGRDVHVPMGCADISCVTTSRPDDGVPRHHAGGARPIKQGAKMSSAHRAEARPAKVAHAARLHRDHPHAVRTVKVLKARVGSPKAPEPMDQPPVAAPLLSESKAPEIKASGTKPAAAPAQVVAPIATPTIEPSKAAMSAGPGEPKAGAPAPRDITK